MSPSRPHGHFLHTVLGLISSKAALLVLGACALGVSVFAVTDASHQRPNDGTVWLLGRPDIVILEVPARQGEPASQLQPGDQVLGIANKLVASPQDAASLLRRQQVGSTVPYLVHRQGEDVIVPVLLTPFRVADRYYVWYVALAFVYLTIGASIYLKSHDDQPARLFYVMCLLFGVFFVTNLNRSSYFWGDIITRNASALARFLLPALFLHFFLVFPQKKFFITRYPFAEPLLYLLPAMFYVQFTLDQFFGSHGPRIGTTRWLILAAYFASGLAALLHSYQNYRDPLQKRRVRILTIGTLAGMLPFLVFKIGLEEMKAYSDLAFLGIAPLIAIPTSFGYCVARYRVMQVGRSFVYTLLSMVVFAGYFALAIGLGLLLLHLLHQTNQIVMVVTPLVVAGLLWGARSRLQAVLDRRFFRTRTHLASVLQEFSREIPRLLQRDVLLERVAARLCGLLDLPRLAVYLREEGEGPVAWKLAGQFAPAADPVAPVDEAPTPPFPAELPLQATIRRLERFHEPFWVEQPTTKPEELGPAVTREQEELALRLEEQQHLARAGVALLVPLVSQGRLVGLFALPRKHSADAFQVQDLDLLTIVAGQVALQVENSRLYEEEVEKQKLEEQLALARTIQSRLLPSRIPAVPGAELSAINITSAQVSGDYYDLIVRSDGCVGLVISDVSGKGIPASLLASGLQAALRAHCGSTDSPGLILQRVNLHLHASTDPQHFATLFLGFYDPRTRRLRYSSGGHNPPILRRRDGAIELLEEGGLPLGAFDFGSYAEGEVQLAPGDLVFLYTDGLTETRNADGEEFGTTRVEQLLHREHERPVDALISTVSEQLRLFSGRAVADDDVTLIVLKVREESAASAELAVAGAQAGAAARS